ncbi:MULTISPECIES: DUF2878 domain-containing protein [Pseudomonas]|uniref:DUF2878 domain-containing protein n=1 Tax=Pseudomonas TaxID=286 RepID=UPI001BEC3830|nr:MULTISPECIES: DUF2878 domain-containing protein [Pseudomonas]MBT2341192.1 DUF2878 domain-containing protein [Pseudomonas fluorescens]MCD4531281.1 DUF2878 domain-containing protein [Pseudomonas sp. C3-2018]
MARGWMLGNALWLQVGWWACVLGAHRPWMLLIVPVGLAAHLWRCPQPGAEVRALLRVTLGGCLLDSLLGAVGVFRFDQQPLPVWLALLWLVLASGLRHSLAWIRRDDRLAALLGMLGGPPAYLAGAGLAGVDLPMGEVGTALLLAPVWALVLPLALRVAAWR